MAKAIHYLLEVCPQCEVTHSQLAVVDSPGEDCELQERIADYRAIQAHRPKLCLCGSPLVARPGKE